MMLGSVQREMYFLCMDVERTHTAALSNLYFSLSTALKEEWEGETLRKEGRGGEGEVY